MDVYYKFENKIIGNIFLYSHIQIVTIYAYRTPISNNLYLFRSYHQATVQRTHFTSPLVTFGMCYNHPPPFLRHPDPTEVSVSDTSAQPPSGGSEKAMSKLCSVEWKRN